MNLLVRWFLYLLSIAVLLHPAGLSAQSFMDEPGIPAFTTAFPVENGFINLANGNLHIEIPIASYPQRGNFKSLQARLVYDSRFWNVGTDLNGGQFWQRKIPRAGVPVGGNFRLITGGEAGTATFTQSTQQCGSLVDASGVQHPQYRTTYENYTYQDAVGTNHEFTGYKLYQSSPYCANGGQVPTGTLYDRDGYEMVVVDNAITVFAPDGTQLTPSGGVGSAGSPQLQDTNGNFTTFAPGQTFANTVDTMGRTPVVTTFSGSQVFLDYLCAQGCNPSGGDRARITLNIGMHQYNTAFNAIFLGSAVKEYSGLGDMLDSIVFPDGSSYQFLYDTYGQITSMTLRTGGTVSYNYTNITDYAGDTNRWVSSRTSDGNTWTFNTAMPTCGGCPFLVTVTGPPYNDGTSTGADDHVYTFSPSGTDAWNTQIQYFRGPSSGTPIVTKVIEHGTAGSCPALLSSISQLIVRETLTWTASTGTLSKKHEYCYDTSNSPNVSVEKMWDYQPNGSFPAAPDREIDNTYVTDAAYVSANVLKLLKTTTTKGAGGNQVAQTTYGYDEYGNPGLALQTSGITTGHNTPTGPRANLTSVSRWLNTSTSPVVSTTEYYDTGEIYQTSDPLKHTTTLTYDSTGAYPSKTCNALNQCSYSAYDFNTGLLTTSTDANGSALGDPAHTSRYTYDSMLRPLCSNQADGGQTCMSYRNPTTIDLQQKITTALTGASSTMVDGFGRLSQTQHTMPAGVAKVDTQYDPLGRVFSVSNPYFATTDTTYGVMQTLYDALSRPVQITKQDGSIATVAYSARGDLKALCSTHTDEAGNQRRTCTNGFGELAEADEPGDSYVGAQAQGNLTVAGSLRFTSTSGAKATGSITVTGAEQCTSTSTGGGCIRSPSGGLICSKVEMSFFRYIVTPAATFALQTTVCDSGNVNVTVNGQSFQQPYQSGNSATTVASNLANLIRSGSASVDYTGVVTNSTTSATIFLQARSVGSAGNNITLSASPSSFDTADFTAASFNSNVSGATLSGGVDPVVTGYDSGSAALTVGSFTGQSVRYSSTQNTNAVDLANAVVGAFNTSPGAPAVAALNPAGSSTIKITYNAYSFQGNGSASVSSTPDNAATYPGGSFSGSTTLAGGQDPTGPGLDHNYFVTLYGHDALGNLLTVTQKGDPAATSSSQWRVRNFTYDSLSRLLTADNPESGHMSYTYDNDGELIQKTSPAPNQTGTATQQISYCYDPLHRTTDKSYTAQAPVIGQPCTLTGVVVHQAYDTGANGIGYLTSLTDQAGSGSYSYDNVGRISTETRALSGVSKSISYEYNLDGSIKALHYPSGAVVTYMPDSAGDIVSAVDSTSGINYINSASYQADGQLTGFISGIGATFAGITSSFSYNKRLQPINITASSPSQPVFSIGYEFHAGNGTAGTGTDNGNVWNIYNFRDRTRDQTFNYDILNRLTSAQNAGTNCAAIAANGKTEYWGNTYGYDPWGNLIQKSPSKCSAESLSVTALVQNQLSGYGYDAAGNVTSDPTDQLSATYNPENRIASSTSTKTGITATYVYDADGNRVQKAGGGTSTLYWYMTPGVVAESDLAGSLKSEYVFLKGERVARRDLGTPGGVFYYFSDHLQTASVITDSAGNIKAESDYYPWGGELQLVANDSNHYKFTDKERDDTESGLDYFGARYYSNALGRFLSADWSDTPEPAPYSDLTDPQSLNLYSYTRGLPTTRFDEDGHQGVPPASDDELYCAALCAKPKPKPKPPKPPEPPPAPPDLPPLPTLPLGPEEINQPCETDCARAMIDRLLQLLNFFDKAKTGEVSPPGQVVNSNNPPVVPANLQKLAKVLRVLSIIDATGRKPVGYEGGRSFKNKEGYLPAVDGNGNPITYTEWDVNPKQPGVDRGTERLVTGSDGSAYYTDSHYKMNSGSPAFQKIR